MILHFDPSFTIYTGNAGDRLFPHDYLALARHDSLIDHHSFVHLKKRLAINRLFFLRQTHSVDGLIITPSNIDTHSFAHEGDFILTNLRHVGIGVMTADCLPLALYDPIHHAIAIVHAGWRGAVNGIVQNVINAMHSTYGTRPDELKIFFGPSARACCYQVSENFKKNLQHFTDAHELVRIHDNALFFDLPACVRRQFVQLGVSDASLHEQYNHCTIHDHAYFSHRRQQEQAGRQMMVISLL